MRIAACSLLVVLLLAAPTIAAPEEAVNAEAAGSGSSDGVERAGWQEVDSVEALEEFEGESIDLGEEDVVAERSTTEGVWSHAASTLIDKVTLERAGSLESALAQVPGISVKRLGGLGQLSTAQIRGARGQQVLVLKNGRPISPGQSTDLSQIPVNSLLRVEILRGAHAVRFGSGALGGVINLITQDRPWGPSSPESEEGVALSETFPAELSKQIVSLPKSSTISFEVSSLGGGSVATASSDRDVSWDVKYGHSDNDYSFVGNDGSLRRRMNNASETLQLSGSAFEGATSWDFMTTSMHRGVPGSAEFPTLQARYSRELVQLGVSEIDGSQGLISFSRDSFFDPQPYLHAGELRSQSERLHLSFDSVRVEDWQYSAAFDGIDASDFGKKSRLMLKAAWENESSNTDFSTLAHFELTAVPGQQLHPAFSASISQPVGKDSIAYALCGYRFRLPDFDELYLLNQGSLRGNPDLQPEKCFSVEIGTKQVKALSSAEIALFADRYIDSIIFAPVSAYLVEARNTGQVWICGAEGNLNSQLTESLDFGLAATYLPLAEYDSGVALTGRSRWHLAASLVNELPGGNSFRQPWCSLSAEFTSSIPADLFGNLAIPKRTVASLASGFDTETGQWRLSVNNLFDAEASDAWNYPLPGRQVELEWSTSF